MAGFFFKKRRNISAACLFIFLSILSFPRITQAEPETHAGTEERTGLEADSSEYTGIENTSPEADSSEYTSIEESTSENTLDTEEEPAKIYHAALGLRTSGEPQLERFGYFFSAPGVYCPFGEENWNHLTYDERIKTDTKSKKTKAKGAKNANSAETPVTKKMVTPGEFTDVELKGNGTYQVTLEHADFQNETTLSLLQIATDIPFDAGITLSDIHVIINKRELVSFKEAFLEDDETFLTGGMVVLLLSHRQYGLKGRLSRLGHPEDTPDGWKVLRGGKDECITVTFTVSGFDYDNEDAQPKTPKKSELRKIIGSDTADNPAKENERGGISIVAVVGIILVILAALITGVVIRRREKVKTSSQI